MTNDSKDKVLEALRKAVKPHLGKPHLPLIVAGTQPPLIKRLEDLGLTPHDAVATLRSELQRMKGTST